MSLWSEVPFESVYLEPSKNGINRPRSTRGSGYKMINMGELFAYGRINNPEMELVPLNDDEKQKYGVQEGDLLFARQSLVKEGAGKCSIVLSVPETTCFEGHLIRVRLDKSKVEPLFYYYYFSSHEGNGRVQSLVMQVAAAGIRGSELAKLNVPYPPLPTQRRIADILSAYDDLIENNTRRIRILEQMAQAIYHEWFGKVDKESLPEGWSISKFIDVCSELIDGDWIETKDQSGEDYRLLQVSNIGLGDFVETGNFRYITQETFDRLNCNEVVSGDILISRMPKPIGRGWLVTEMPWRMITAVDVAIARPNPDLLNRYYCIYWLNSPEILAKSEQHASGTTRPRITRRDLAGFEMVVPPIELQNKFGEIAKQFYELQTNLRRKNANLRQTRDLLLPRLVSGEVEV